MSENTNDNGKREKTNIRKFGRFKIGTILVVMFLLIYVPSLLYWTFSKDIKTDLLREGSIENSVTANGIIIRSEKVLSSDFEGSLIPEVSSGEKVAKGFKIATVVNKASAGTLDKLNQLELEIAKLENQKMQAQGVVSQDIAFVDGQIKDQVRDLVNAANYNDFSNISTYTDSIEELLKQKSNMAGSAISSDPEIKKLLDEKSSLKAEFDANKGEIITDTPGIVSFDVDGYESKLLPENMKALKPSDIDSVESTSSKDAEQATKNKPCAKIMDDMNMYIACTVNKDEVSDLKNGDMLKVRVNDINKIYDASVENISGETDGKKVIILKLDRGISDTSNMRKVNVDIIKQSVEGLKVPLASLLQPDYTKMTAKIIIVKYNYTTTRIVKILGKNDKEAIISTPEGSDKGISLYDTFVINPINIKEGQYIEQ